MAAAHHAPQQPRYALPPPPPNVYNDRRLPSIKDLNFHYTARPPPHAQDPSTASNGSLTVEPSNTIQEHPPRHLQSWTRSSQSVSVSPAMSAQQHPQQQHTPPLSAGHESSAPRIEYAPKHDSAGYLTPGMPLSVQVTPIAGSVTSGPGTRGDEAPHAQSQPKRARTSSTSVGVTREVRPTHVS